MRAFVDQIESGQAKLLLGDDEKISVVIPLECLPDGVREGDVLRLDFSIDEDATADARSRIQSLLNKLGNNP